MPRFKTFCLPTIVVALSSPALSEKMSDADLAGAIQFVNQTDQNEFCNWRQTNDTIYRDMNVSYTIDETITLLGLLCWHGAYLPNHIWLFKSASSTPSYQQVMFAHPVVEEGANAVLGINVATTLPSSIYDPVSQTLIASRWYLAGDISEQTTYQLDYRPDYSIVRFLLKEFSADTIREQSVINVFRAFDH